MRTMKRAKEPISYLRSQTMTLSWMIKNKNIQNKFYLNLKKARKRIPIFRILRLMSQKPQKEKKKFLGTDKNSIKIIFRKSKMCFWDCRINHKIWIWKMNSKATSPLNFPNKFKIWTMIPIFSKMKKSHNFHKFKICSSLLLKLKIDPLVNVKN